MKKIFMSLIVSGALMSGIASERALISDDYTNIFSSAKEIPFNTIINGSIETVKDVDIFKIKLDTADGVTVSVKTNEFIKLIIIGKDTVTNKLNSENALLWDDILLDIEIGLKEEVALSKSFLDYDFESISFNLNANEYYIIVYEAFADETADYSFKIESAENTSEIQLDSVTMDYCKDNPESCGIEMVKVDSNLIYSQSDLETAKTVAKSEAKVECQKDPESCGITSLSETNSIDLTTFQLSKNYIDTLPSGWNLIGTSPSLSDFSIFKDVNIVWIYQNSKWMSYNPNLTLPPEIIVNDFAGFWIKK